MKILRTVYNSYLKLTSLAAALIFSSFRFWILSVILVSFWRETGKSFLLGFLDRYLELGFLLAAISGLFTGVERHWPLFFSTALSFIMGILEANFEYCFLSSAIFDNCIGLGGWYGLLGSASIWKLLTEILEGLVCTAQFQNVRSVLQSLVPFFEAHQDFW